MTGQSRSNLYLGLFCIAFACVLMFIWIPLDTKTGIVVKARGKYNIGDGLAPTVAAVFVLLGGLLMLLERNATEQSVIRKNQLKFVASLTLVIIAGFTIMRFAGPVAVELTKLFRAEPLEYRLLRATAGWKHIGFILGGTFMISGLIAVVERKLTRRAILTGIIAVLVLIAAFDLPFDDLLLPPNGDV
ncbi:hypothetical protein [uncultured Sulfitobacter sp.]|uniref:hypothetical protein n=1 Tax=uncultured Sulfitobacter sp. TaxID=191468 RepID=UPI00262B3A80|nr:hypothetical protein [uncultured Sulfitobacter sp.]